MFATDLSPRIAKDDMSDANSTRWPRSVVASGETMASSSLVLPGALFVGEDDRARIVARAGIAAGWHVPAGLMTWTREVSLVARASINDAVRKATKAVMPEEQIPAARLPWTLRAAKASPFVSIAPELVRPLVELGVHVVTVGLDRVTSSFYFIAEGGGRESMRVEGDLIEAAGLALGDRAETAALERVLDGIVDRLLRVLSHGAMTELAVELASLLPRMASDGSGLEDVALERFEASLSAMVRASEPHRAAATEIVTRLSSDAEHSVPVPLFYEARKNVLGPFALTLGDTTLAMPTYERWVMRRSFAEVAPAVAPPANAANAAKAPIAPREPRAAPIEPRPLVVPSPRDTPRMVADQPWKLLESKPPSFQAPLLRMSDVPSPLASSAAPVSSGAPDTPAVVAAPIHVVGVMEDASPIRAAEPVDLGPLSFSLTPPMPISASPISAPVVKLASPPASDGLAEIRTRRIAAVATKSSAMTWTALVLLVLGALVAYRVWFAP